MKGRKGLHRIWQSLLLIFALLLTVLPVGMGQVRAEGDPQPPAANVGTTIKRDSHSDASITGSVELLSDGAKSSDSSMTMSATETTKYDAEYLPKEGKSLRIVITLTEACRGSGSVTNVFYNGQRLTIDDSNKTQGIYAASVDSITPEDAKRQSFQVEVEFRENPPQGGDPQGGDPQGGDPQGGNQNPSGGHGIPQGGTQGPVNGGKSMDLTIHAAPSEAGDNNTYDVLYRVSEVKERFSDDPNYVQHGWISESTMCSQKNQMSYSNLPGMVYISIEPVLNDKMAIDSGIRAIQVNGQDVSVKYPYATNLVPVTIPDDGKVTIDVKLFSQNAPTIIWSNDGANAVGDYKDFQLANGSARITKVSDSKGHDITGNIYGLDYVSPEESGTEAGREGGLSDGIGYVRIPQGSLVTYEFTPKYGYQLCGIRTNEGDILKAGAETNSYSFTMPAGNVHFEALFEATSDAVVGDSKAIGVDASSVKLGAGEIDAGSVQLSVTDKTVTGEDKVKFETASGGEFTIQNYLNIDLNQVFYKGKKDSSDVWKKNLSTLKKNATISIKLNEALPAGTVVEILHKKHDGNVEVIQASYDASTQMLTFETDEFSDYAIAVKTKTDSKTDSLGSSDASTQMLTFETDEFSDYAIAVKTKTDSKTDSLGSSGSKTVKSPKTMDDSFDLLTWIILLLSVGGVSILLAWKKRQNEMTR